MADLFYYESGYIDDSYFVYTADAASAQTSSTTMTAAVGVIKSANSALTVTTSVTATISHIEGADLFAFTEAALTLEVSRLRDNNAEITSSFAQVISGSKFIYVGSDQYADTSFNVDSLRVRNSEAATTAAFSLAADGELAGQIVQSEATLTTSFNFDVDLSIIKLFSGNLTSEFTQQADTRKIIPTSCQLDSQFDVSSNISCIKESTITAGALFTPGINCVAVKNTFAVLETTSSLSFSGDITKDTLIQLSLNSSQELIITKIVNSSINQSVEFTILADPGLVKESTITAGALFTPGINCVAVKNTFAVLESISSIEITAISVNSFNSDLSASTSMQVTALGYKHSAVELVIGSSLTFSGQIINKRPLQVSSVSSGVVISSAQSVLGNASLYVPFNNVTTTNLRYYGSSDFQIATNQDFNIEFFYYLENRASNNAKEILSFYDQSRLNKFWAIQLTPNSPYNIQFYANSDYSGVSSAVITGSFTLQTSTWYYFRVYRSNGVITFQYSIKSGGTWSTISTIGTTNSTLSFGWPALSSTSQNLILGDVSNANTGGYYDEVYIAKGTSQSQQFQTGLTPNRINQGKESTTLALLHFDTDFNDDINGIVSIQESLQSNSQLSIQVDNIVKSTSANLQANGFVVAAIGKIIPEFADLSSEFQMTANFGKLLPTASANITSTSQLSCSALDLDLAVATITSQFVLTVNAREIPVDAYEQSTTEALIHFESYPLVDVMRSGSPTATVGSTFETAKFNNGMRVGGGFSWRESTNIDLSNGEDFVAEVWYQNHGDYQNYGAADTEILTIGDGASSRVTYTPIVPYGNTTPTTETIGLNVSLYSVDFHSSLSGYPNGSGGYISNNWGLSENQIYVNWASNNISPPPESHRGPVLSSGPWYHILVSRTSGTYRLFVNGSLTNTWTDQPVSGSYPTTVVEGGEPGGDSGTVDEFRLRKGVGQVSNFSVPTTQYPEVSPFLKQFTFDVTSDFTLGANVQRVKLFEASFSTSSQLNSSAKRYRGPSQTDLASIVSQNTTAQKKAVLNSNLTSNFGLSPTPRVLRGLTSNPSLVAGLTVNAMKATVTDASLAVQATQVTNNGRYRNPGQQLSSAEFTQSTSAVKTSRPVVSTQAIASELAIAYKTGQGLLGWDSYTTMAVQAVLTTDQVHEFTSTTSLTANGINTLFGQANLQSTSALTIDFDYLRRTESIMTSEFSQTTGNNRLRDNQVQTSAESALIVDNSRTRNLASTQSAEFAVTSNNQIVRLASADLQVESTIPFALAGIMVRIEADLLCEGFQLTAGRIIHIDPYYQLVIDPESRYLKVIPETRLLTINQETRVNKIIGR